MMSFWLVVDDDQKCFSLSCKTLSDKIIIQGIVLMFEYLPINTADGDIGAAIFPFMLVSVPKPPSAELKSYDSW